MAIPAPASGRPSNPATSFFRSRRTGALSAPRPWATYEARNPCGAEVDGRAKTLASFEPFLDFNQSAFLPGVAANPLVAQNRTYTRYEVRLNEPEYSALAFNGWSRGENLPDEAHPAHLPAGSIAVKAAWRLLTAADTPAIRARYYVVENAEVVDVAKTLAAGRVVCAKSDVALVGLHIVIKTKYRPQGIWSTFEHVDNVPPAGEGEAREPDAKDAGAPYSFFDPSKPVRGLWPTFGAPGTLPVSLENAPEDRPGADASGAPASDPSRDHGDQSSLLGLARNQGNRVGALHAGRGANGRPSPARTTRKTTASISPG